VTDSELNGNGSKIDMGKWNPHLDGNQFGLVCVQSVCGVDIRSMQRVWEFKSAHKFQVRDIDFNPNKQYYFATCGDDCATRFWDIRKPDACLKEVYEHSHW
jgi:WD40 repeat protein